jgi:trimeric autotransporter adhesin
MNPLIQLKSAAPVFVVALVCVGLLPTMRAVSPVPDGGYPGGNTAEGQNALLNLTTGGFNTAVGYLSLRSNTTNSFNTALGAGALFLNTADENTATGTGALLSNTTGTLNTANGAFALLSNITGFQNTATGAQALYLNTIGSFNTANGISALFNNTTGNDNTANGGGALYLNTTGSFNTADGFEALHNNNGDSNTANGYHALYNNTTGNFNTANGDEALLNNITGSLNTAVGADALFSNTTGSQNVALGPVAGYNATTGSNNIYIGDIEGNAGESNHTYIGNIDVTSLPSGGTVDFVTIDTSTGLLGHNSSSRRYKEDIKPMDKSSQALYRLKPVTYRVKKEINSAQPTAFGLIAEEVAEVNPDLIVRNAQGQVEGVHYDQVNAMLLNEFLKEHRKVENLKNDFQAAVAQQQKEIAALTATGKKQAAQIQRVSAQLEASKPAPRVVNNP